MWQELVNHIAIFFNIPSVLIMRVEENSIGVYLSNTNLPTNVYTPGCKEELNGNLYCEWVIENQKKLLVTDARNDPEWDSNPDLEFNMVSYLGFPLNWPSGQPFGTICVLDNKSNSYDEKKVNLLMSFSNIINSNLSDIYVHSELNEIVENLKSFNHMAAHDLVTPIYKIDLLCDKLHNKVMKKEEIETEVLTIKKSCLNLMDLVKDFSLLSNVTNNDIKFNDTDLNDVAEKAKESLKDKITISNTEIIVHELPQISCASNLILQIFINLIENAIKYHGTDSIPKIEIGTMSYLKKTHHSFYIKDNGIGIKEENHAKLFEAFKRFEVNTSINGSGLGLYIVKKIVELHQGQIKVNSALNEGTTFEIIIPKERG